MSLDHCVQKRAHFRDSDDESRGISRGLPGAVTQALSHRARKLRAVEVQSDAAKRSWFWLIYRNDAIFFSCSRISCTTFSSAAEIEGASARW